MCVYFANTGIDSVPFEDQSGARNSSGVGNFAGVVFAEAVGAAACASLVAVRVINYQGVLGRLRKTRRCVQKEFPLCVRASFDAAMASKLDPCPFWLGRFLEGFSSKKDASEEVAPREVSLAKGWGPTRAQGVRPN